MITRRRWLAKGIDDSLQFKNFVRGVDLRVININFYLK